MFTTVSSEVMLLLIMKNMIYGSIEELRMPNLSGSGRETLLKKKTPEEKIWTLLRQPTTRLVDQLQEASLVKAKFC